MKRNLVDPSATQLLRSGPPTEDRAGNAMTLDVAERGRHIATFRFVAVRLMETAAAWTPTTPEMEVKVLFGRHIWDFAQHADALGRRTFELRMPVQHSLAPAATRNA